MTEQERLNAVNEFIKVIASFGRKFFSENSDGFNGVKESPFISFMEIDERGRVWFTDYYTKKRIYTHYPYRWKGFTSGGTLKSLVEAFREFIKKGALLNKRYFEPNSLMVGGHSWGYGEDLEKVREAAIRLGIAS